MSSLADSQNTARDDDEQLACCGKKKFLHRLTYSVAVVDVIIVLVLINFYAQFTFNHNQFDDSLFSEEFVKTTSREQKENVESRLLTVIFPIFMLLFGKMWVGVRWIRLKYSRNSLSTFYVVSFAFYFAMFF